MGIFDDFITGCAADCVDSKHAERVAEDSRKLYKCCSPNCPGFPYRASEWAHPADICTEKVKP